VPLATLLFVKLLATAIALSVVVELIWIGFEYRAELVVGVVPSSV
jgi:hypothetical protein